MNSIVYAGRNTAFFTCKHHSHEEWEMVYCTEGQGRFEFEGHTLHYSAGELVMIPPRVLHTNICSEDYADIHIGIDDIAINLREPTVISDDEERHIMGTFTDACYFFNSDMDGRQLIVSAFGDLIVNYVIAFRDTKPLRDVVNEIKSNIMQNYTDCDYELDTYLRTIPFSYDYLRKLFKREMGMTPHSYLTNLRIQRAEKLLCSSGTSEQSISEIAYICGYSDSLYFSRVFKKNYGCSPKYYAAMHCMTAGA